MMMYDVLGGGFQHVLFSPLPGEMIQFDEHIFQMGWFNHQLEDDVCIIVLPIPDTQCMVYLPAFWFTFMVNVGKYINPMDPGMGNKKVGIHKEMNYC